MAEETHWYKIKHSIQLSLFPITPVSIYPT